MKDILEYIEGKGVYFTPTVEVQYLDTDKDVLCMSSEGNDNDFGAGGLDGFLD